MYEVTGIILAGGKSTRMGTEKGLQKLYHEPLISYAIDALKNICTELVISSSTDAYNQFGYRVVPDEFPGIGPMGGIYSVLKQSKSKYNLVLSCDLPFVSELLLNYILLSGKGYMAAVPCEGNRHYEPLCGFYDQSIVDRIKDFIQKSNYKLPDLFEEISINKLSINSKLPFYHKDLFLNVNSKQDLAIAESIMQKKL